MEVDKKEEKTDIDEKKEVKKRALKFTNVLPMVIQ